MKKLIVLSAIFISGLLCGSTFAQVSSKVNIASQPIWGPVGYDHVEYYYFPEIDVYYYVPNQKFIYMQYGHWIFRILLIRSL